MAHQPSPPRSRLSTLINNMREWNIVFSFIFVVMLGIALWRDFDRVWALGGLAAGIVSFALMWRKHPLFATFGLGALAMFMALNVAALVFS